MVGATGFDPMLESNDAEALVQVRSICEVRGLSDAVVNTVSSMLRSAEFREALSRG
jgi:hypothetical protein